MPFKPSTLFIALTSFAAGSFLTTRLAHPAPASADATRVFELRVYHAVPGKLPALEARFENITSKLLVRHKLNVLGYWTSDDAGPLANSFIWVVAHSSREDAKQNWDALRADPDFQEMAKSEQAEKTVEKVEATYMRPSDFSALK